MVVLSTPRVCSRCGLPKTWYYEDRRRSSGLQAQCRDCQVEANRLRYASKSDIERASIIQQVKARRDRRRYGLPKGGRDKILQAQGYKCALCGTPDPGSKKDWHVDHDHTTGAVRGILCARCNRGLGHLGDTAEGLKAALAYVTNGAHTVDAILNEASN